MEGDRLAKSVGLTGTQWKVLGSIGLYKKNMTVSGIARMMGLKRQSVQRTADLLQKNGYILFTENPKHKKAKIMSHTKKGQLAMSKLNAIEKVWAIEHVREFNEKDLHHAVSILRKIGNRFNMGDSHL